MMKAILFTLLATLVIQQGLSQEKNIETRSVELDELIPFMVTHFKPQADPPRNIVFLIQVSESGLDAESQIVLKQAFKLLSGRLTEDDVLSFVTYSGFNGIALKQTPPGDLKKILSAIEDLKGSVKEFHSDGIDLAYAYTNENFMTDGANTLVIVRNSTSGLVGHSPANPSTANPQARQRNKAVLITAMSLVPEILAIIKD